MSVSHLVAHTKVARPNLFFWRYFYSTNLFQLRHCLREESDEHCVVVGDCHACDLCQTLEGHVAEHRHIEKLKWNFVLIETIPCYKTAKIG